MNSTNLDTTTTKLVTATTDFAAAITDFANEIQRVLNSMEHEEGVEESKEGVEESKQNEEERPHPRTVSPPKKGRLNNQRTDFNYKTRKTISELITQNGRKQITLQELYIKLNAKTKLEKNGVQYGVWFAKRISMIRNTDKRGIYAIC